MRRIQPSRVGHIHICATGQAGHLTAEPTVLPSALGDQTIVVRSDSIDSDLNCIDERFSCVPLIREAAKNHPYGWFFVLGAGCRVLGITFIKAVILDDSLR